jgi:queuine tRNA-ribosyltransferase
MQGLRAAIAAGNLEQFVEQFYIKRGLPVPALQTIDSNTAQH